MIFLPLSALSMLRNSLPAFHIRKTRQLMKYVQHERGQEQGQEQASPTTKI